MNFRLPPKGRRLETVMWHLPDLLGVTAAVVLSITAGSWGPLLLAAVVGAFVSAYSRRQARVRARREQRRRTQATVHLTPEQYGRIWNQHAASVRGGAR